ncbi:MAG: acetyl-CoA carboxylase biotin carboxyl carrier protein [Acidimicrobiales bacterium]
MILSREDVGDILKVLDSTDYDELHLETDRFVLRLRRLPGGWTAEHEARGEVRLVPGTTGEDAGRDAGRDGDAGAGAAAQDPEREGLHAVRAPLPGVLYRSPKPGAPAFVEVGDTVAADTVVAILETMKLMNPVRAGAAGTVADFAVANNEPVEQGAVLVWLAPDEPAPGGS